MRQTQLKVAGLVLIGSASLRRRHFESRELLNSYRAGAHCDLVTHDVSALCSVGGCVCVWSRLNAKSNAIETNLTL